MWAVSRTNRLEQLRFELCDISLVCINYKRRQSFGILLKTKRRRRIELKWGVFGLEEQSETKKRRVR